MEICKNCNAEVQQNFCPNCGHPAQLKRINGRYIIQEIRVVLNVEKGILYTIKALTINPGSNLKLFLNTNRMRLVKPIVFLIVTSLIYTLVNNLFHFEEVYVSQINLEESTTLKLMRWVQNNYGYTNLIMSVFIGMWLKVFFRKHNYNIFEIFVVLCYVMGMGMLIYTLFGIAQGITGINLMQYAILIGFIYTTYAIGHFYDKRKVKSYVNAFFAYLVGLTTFSFAIGTIGVIIDLVILK